MHIRSYRAVFVLPLQKVSLQLLSEQSVGDVRIMQLDWKRQHTHTHTPV